MAGKTPYWRKTAGTRDITRFRRQDNILRKSEEMLKAILNTATDAIITINRHGIIQSVNAATQPLFGYAPEQLIGRNVKLLMPEPYRGEHDGYLRRYCRTGRARIISIGREVTGLRKDGKTFPMHLAVSEVRLNGQRFFTGIVHDLTERRRLERQILETAANEQRRIGRDLHDGLCQDLIGIAFNIDAIARKLARNPADGPLAELAASIRKAAGHARRLAHGLNPIDLKVGGLPLALENLALTIADSYHIRCTSRWDGVAQVDDDTTATHLFRIAQEATSNAIRHGRATRVQIDLAEQGGSAVLSIADNGTGMPQRTLDAIKKGLVLTGRGKNAFGGMGLQTMHYRARVVGGTFTIKPRKGGGTLVICTIGREHSVHEPHIPTRRSARRKAIVTL